MAGIVFINKNSETKTLSINPTSDLATNTIYRHLCIVGTDSVTSKFPLTTNTSASQYSPTIMLENSVKAYIAQTFDTKTTTPVTVTITTNTVYKTRKSISGYQYGNKKVTTATIYETAYSTTATSYSHKTLSGTTTIRPNSGVKFNTSMVTGTNITAWKATASGYVTRSWTQTKLACDTAVKATASKSWSSSLTLNSTIGGSTKFVGTSTEYYTTYNVSATYSWKGTSVPMRKKKTTATVYNTTKSTTATTTLYRSSISATVYETATATYSTSVATTSHNANVLRS